MLRALTLLCLVGALWGAPNAVCAQELNKNASMPAPTLQSLLLKQEQTGSVATDQKIERLQYEDSGARIEELRVGGESQAVTVQPKLPVPAWQMLRESGVHGPHGSGVNDSAQSRRARVWNLLAF